MPTIKLGDGVEIEGTLKKRFGDRVVVTMNGTVQVTIKSLATTMANTAVPDEYSLIYDDIEPTIANMDKIGNAYTILLGQLDEIRKGRKG